MGGGGCVAEVFLGFRVFLDRLFRAFRTRLRSCRLPANGRWGSWEFAIRKNGLPLAAACLRNLAVWE